MKDGMIQNIWLIQISLSTEEMKFCYFSFLLSLKRAFVMISSITQDVWQFLKKGEWFRNKNSSVAKRLIDFAFYFKKYI
jgi:hypothetical protein